MRARPPRLTLAQLARPDAWFVLALAFGGSTLAAAQEHAGAGVPAQRAAPSPSTATSEQGELPHVLPGSFPTLPAVLRSPDGTEFAGTLTVSSPAGWVLVGPPVQPVAIAAGEVLTTGITLYVPENAPARRTVAARAELRNPAGAVVAEALVDAVVTRVHRPVIRFTHSHWPAPQGKEVAVPFFLENAGNAADTLHVISIGEPGWELSDSVHTVVLGPGERRELALRVRPPQELGPGGRGRIAFAVATADTSTTAEAFVEVREPAGGDETTHSLLTTTVSTVATATAEPGLDQFRVMAQGTLGTDWRVNLRYQDQAQRDGIVLGSLAYGLPTLALRAFRPGASVALGDLDADFSDVTGSYLFGNGVDVALSGRAGRVRLLAARPGRLLPGRIREGGHLLGAELGRSIGPVGFTARATDLERQDGFFGEGSESLRAASLEATAPGPLRTRVSAEVGVRSVSRDADAARTTAWRVGVERVDPGRAFHVTYLRAPGHAQGFAPSGKELSTAGNVAVLPRVAATWTLRRVTNEDGDRLGLRSSSWSVGPRVSLTQNVGALVTAEGSSSELSGAFGYSQRDRSGQLRGDAVFGPLQLTGGFGLGTRSVDGGEPRRLFSHEARLQWQTPWAIVWGEELRRTTSEGSSLDVTATTIGVSGVELAGRVTLSGEISRQRYGFAGATTQLRGTAEAPLGAGFQLRVAAERSRFNALLQGREWIVAAELSRTFGVPLPIARGSVVEGRIYRDRDGDGARGADDTPLPNVRVTLGSRSVRTDRDGEFRIVGLANGTYGLELDVATLPAGEGVAWSTLPPVTVRGGSQQRLEIPIRPYGSLEGYVFFDDDEDGTPDAAEIPVAGLVLILESASGSVRTLQSAADGSFRFGGLPPGTYRLRYRATTDVAPLDQPVEVQIDPERTSRLQLPARSGSPVIMTFDAPSTSSGSAR